MVLDVGLVVQRSDALVLVLCFRFSGGAAIRPGACPFRANPRGLSTANQCLLFANIAFCVCYNWLLDS
jgi:hypothetical protein